MDKLTRALLIQEMNKRQSEPAPTVREHLETISLQGDIHDLPFSERIKYLDKIPESEHVKKGDRILCHSEAEARKAIEKIAKQEGSEGAYLKKADFVYELDGKTLNNIKFKNELSAEVQIVKVNIVKEAK